MSIFYVGSYAQLFCRQISRMIWQKRRKKSREMPLFLFFFWIFTRASFEGHTPHAQAGQRRAPLARPNPRTTASSALESRTRRTAHTAHTQSTMPHALAATSRPAMTVRAFEIAGTNARHTAWTLMARPRGFTARRVLRRALARDTMRAEHVSRARARTPRSRLARTRVRRTRTTDASRPESSASFLTAERRQPPRPAGFSRRSGSDRDPSNVQYRRRFVPRARPRPSRRPPRALARSGARAHASPPAHQVRNNRVLFPATRVSRGTMARTHRDDRGANAGRIQPGHRLLRLEALTHPPEPTTYRHRRLRSRSHRRQGASRRQQVASPSGRVTPRAEKLHRFRSNWTADALAFRAVFAIDRG